MKKGIDAAMTIFPVAGAGVLGIILVLGPVLSFGWPWWVALFLLLLVSGLFLGVLILRKGWLRRREMSCADLPGTGDQADALAQSGKSGVVSLKERWRTAVGTLRQSQLNKLGNPLYVLPWYLMIGTSGSGKSASLVGARLTAPIGAGNRLGDEISATEQCEWWFFEQAVVVDCAGRYAMPLSEEQDREEWLNFLSLMMKYRPREPLNGVIVTVAADRLLDPGDVQLEQEGDTIRRRIDELMRAVGVRVPVYLLVTKCDLIRGIKTLCDHLPSQCLDQPIGVINQDLSSDTGAFVQRALQRIVERLRELRLQLLHQPQGQDAGPELLLFPEEFEQLNQGLAQFMSHAFGANPYQETPMLRGLFFSSARNEGEPYSRFCPKGAGPTQGSPLPEGPGGIVRPEDGMVRREDGMVRREDGMVRPEAGAGRPGSSTGRPEFAVNRPENALPGSGRGCFLHDFFARILPSDRYLLTPTRSAIKWRTLVAHMGLTCWVIVGIAFCGLLSFSFVRNIATIRNISNAISQTSALHGDMPADLAALERFRQDILKVEEQNRNWWMPRFGLTESIQVEKRLKSRFCRQFQELILSPFDKQMAAGIASVSPASPDNLYAQYVMHLVRRINILKARLGNSDLATLQAKPQPVYFQLLATPAAADTPEARKAFGTLYLSSLIWREDSSQVSDEITRLQSRLKQLVGVKGSDLQWLAVWVDRRSGISPVTLKDFWGGSLMAHGEKSLAPTFTLKGKETLDSLVEELEAALPDPGQLAPQKSGFAGWYRSAAFEAWRVFAADFPKGAERLQGATEWQQAASKMASDQGPYFALLSRIAQELEPLAAQGPLPPWLQQVYQYQEARAGGAIQDNGTIGKAAEGGKKILSTITKSVGQQAGAQKLETQLATTRACREYSNALTAIAPAVASRTQLFQLASQTFSEDPTTGKSPLYAASASAARLKSGICQAAPDPLFSMLLNGPLEFLWTYLRKESAAQLQALWEEQVLAATMGMTSEQATPALLGPDGVAWRFVKGPAAPFLARNISGYHAKETPGGKIPFEGALFSFMNKGVQAQATVMAMGRAQSYRVGIKGLPTDANSEARTKPHTTRLEMHCGGSSQSLVNNNYPVGQTFSWSPDACSDVQLQIEVGDVVLTRHYLGSQGFPDFLKDLHGGRRTFAASEFPGERSALGRMGVKTITVNYQLIGSAPVLRQNATLSVQAPRTIARGWGQ